jgi:hypothetical protein
MGAARLELAKAVKPTDLQSVGIATIRYPQWAYAQYNAFAWDQTKVAEFITLDIRITGPQRRLCQLNCL